MTVKPKPKLILVLTLTFGLKFLPFNGYSMALVLLCVDHVRNIFENMRLMDASFVRKQSKGPRLL